MRRWITCEVCGKPFVARTTLAKMCSGKCRMEKSRKLQREREAMQWMSSPLVVKLSEVLPETSQRLHAFVMDNGLECGEAAVKLVLTAVAERLSSEAR